ncbi:unnamed protein product [Dicrocoelium dendriticum]|nr:unnamed protein product [Dicrocoelium dendriticum]
MRYFRASSPSEMQLKTSSVRNDYTRSLSVIGIFNLYQEQPHLLDPCLERLISECLVIVHSFNDDPNAFHFAFRVLHLMVKTRGYKSIIRLMPHTVEYIEPVLSLLVSQDINDPKTWETRYVLLLWLSILALVPFKLTSLDSNDQEPITERILDQSKRYLSHDTRIQEPASFLLARLVTRPDIVQTHLHPTVSWCLEQLLSADYKTSHGLLLVCGLLRAVANICKIGRRNEVLPLAPVILHTVSQIPCTANKGTLLSHLETKLLQRVGLLFCPPRSMKWQYQRGCRSLADNLVSQLMHHSSSKSMLASDSGSSDTIRKQDEVTESLDIPLAEEEDDLYLEHADKVADVIDRLLNALRNQYTVVRWSAAKGLGRMCSRMGSSMLNDVVSALLVLCTRVEPFSSWHGACLALAELGRRSLLLPSKLPEVIPVIMRALFYDERSGDHSYGSNVRDAACYLCWSFARAYRAQDFSAYVNQVATALLLVSLFDREVNVRRAAAAAFQENVGRQGQFPHGIDIITTCDYFALRNRNSCFLDLSVFVAQFAEYTIPMIDHLSDQLLGHWDGSMRLLAARALNALYPFADDYMRQTVLPKLIHNSTEATLYKKHGNILGTAELISAMKGSVIDAQCLSGVKKLVPTLSDRNQFRGVSGGLLRRAVCHLIEKSSWAKVHIHEDPTVDSWRAFLDDCMDHKELEVQTAARDAYPALLAAYLYTDQGVLRVEYRDMILPHMLSQLDSVLEARVAGYLHVLGHAPSDLFSGNVGYVLGKIAACCRITPKSRSWGEARANGLSALVGVCEQLGRGHPELDSSIFGIIGPVLVHSLSDYTVDSRGDIGSQVREAGMKNLHRLFSFMTTSGYEDLIQPRLVKDAVVGIAQQAVEKIDRTRGIAGQSFASILHHDPPIPHVPMEDTLKRVFCKEDCDLIVWRSARQTFPKFIQLLDLRDFRFHLILGLAVSIGGLTEDTVLSSTEALTNYLISHEADQPLLDDFMSVTEQVFYAFSHDDRVVIPLFRFVDFLLNNPVICSTTSPESPILLHLAEGIWTESKSTKDVHRLKAAIDVFGGMLQFEGPIRKQTIHYLFILLGHRYPIVRKSSATKLYECLSVYELAEPDAMEKALNLLIETIWESELDVVRPIRNELCELLRCPVPTQIQSKTSADNTCVMNGLESDTA